MALVLSICCLGGVVAQPSFVTEHARQIPVAYDVDVVVVGGSTGAVAAAAAAAQGGAKVFLAAPRPYLGEDVCGTYRLWLEPGEKPVSALAKKVFGEPPSSGPVLPFTYEADRPSSAAHPDAKPPSLLCDGQWGHAASQSVQYTEDVALTLDLGKEQSLKRLVVEGYQKSGVYAFAGLTISVSSDKVQWCETRRLENTNPDPEEFAPLELATPLVERARYVRLQVRKAPDAERFLLGEILLESAEPSPTDLRRVWMPTPMHVKRALDEVLVEAGVPYLFGCYPTDVLTDASGQTAGIVMANRNGRQAVRAKIILDATERATVARLAGATFQPYRSGPHTFRRAVVLEPGAPAEPRVGNDVQGRELSLRVGDGIKAYRAFEYALTIPMKDGSYRSFAQAEQLARDETFDPAQVDASEFLFQVPPDPLEGRARESGDWPGAATVSLDVFRPARASKTYVLGGCADLSRDAAAKLLRPLELMEVGARLGRRAAEGAKTLARPTGVRLAGAVRPAATTGSVREVLVGVRPTDRGLPTIPQQARSLPVLGEYDVVVAGGGTSGAPAGIGAARHGARTLVLEYLHDLGGVGTLGLIGNYCAGYRGGYTAEHDKEVEALGAAVHVIGKAETWRRTNRRDGVEVWTGALACGALVEKGKVKGIVVATPAGRGVVLAKTTIDATGSGDLAIVAGAGYVYAGAFHVALQGAGLSPRTPGQSYSNTDHTFVADTDMVDVWRAFVYSRQKFANSYDLVPLPLTRERRRIIGDFTVSPLDLVNHRTYPDTIYQVKGGFDTHGFTVDDFFLLNAQGPATGYAPYRCLLPKGLDGILVTGLATSAQRDALPPMRMQSDFQNEGYAAGVAAAEAAKLGGATRKVDLKAVQRHLVDVGCLPGSVLTDRDSYPLPEEQLAEAVKSLAKTKWTPSYTRKENSPEAQSAPGLAVLLTQPCRAVSLLKEAYVCAETEDAKVVYAHVLGMLGDSTGLTSLIAAARSLKWDDGWNFTGMGQFGTAQSRLDSYLVALGRTHDSRAIPPILEKLAELTPASEFSHCRAVALALETLGDPAGARPLAELLAKPGMTGHAIATIEQALETATKDPNDTATRNTALRELVLARALYRCGDYHGLGKEILTQYAHDLHGLYAWHAQAVLRERRR